MALSVAVMLQTLAPTGAWSEPEVAALIDALVADPDRQAEIVDLLAEDHPLYDQRGTAATVRLRGWMLLAFARAGLPEAGLLFVLEELDTGVDPYLVAAAARALRSYPRPAPALAPFVLRAIGNIRYHDDPVSFARYGEYASAAGASHTSNTSPVRELLAALAWLGPHARGVLADVEALRTGSAALSRKLRPDVDRAIQAIGDPATTGDCCNLPDSVLRMRSWAFGARRGSEPLESLAFEDQDGASLSFDRVFRGHPTIVAFFYTRCDNPLKCSLTVTKLARIQSLLDARGLADRIHTAAITYDPAFDLPERLRVYGDQRRVRMDASHRLLRATAGIAALRQHFALGVNFIESLVNRHRIEVYLLDAGGRIAASFERIRWDEEDVVERAVDLLTEQDTNAPPSRAATRPVAASTSPAIGAMVSIAVALFPKCPVCWAAYLSMLGIAGLERIPYAPWLQPLLASVMVINVGSVWLRGRATRRLAGPCLVTAGALAIILARLPPIGWESLAPVGIALTLTGSILSALCTTSPAPAL